MMRLQPRRAPGLGLPRIRSIPIHSLPKDAYVFLVFVGFLWQLGILEKEYNTCLASMLFLAKNLKIYYPHGSLWVEVRLEFLFTP